MDKFWFFAVGVLHVTNKINYMENMLYFAFIKKTMPKAAFEIVYRFRHLVMSFFGNSVRANLSLDEAMEMGLVRHLKMLTTNDPDILERAVAWLELICPAFDVLRRELNTTPRQATRNDDLPSDKAQILAESYNDKEKNTALNVLMIYKFLSKKEWLGDAHRASEFLTNVLISPPFVLKDKTAEDQLINAEKLGRVAASLHLAHKLRDVFGGLSKEDLDTYLKRKEPQGWTLRFRIRSMRDANHDACHMLGKKRPLRKKVPVDSRITKGLKHLSNVRAQLLQMTLKHDTSRESSIGKEMRMRTARVLLNQIEKNEHLMVPLAMAFRSEPSNSFSASEDKREFHRKLQILIKNNLSLSEKGDTVFAQRSSLRPVRDVATIHVDLMPVIEQPASPKMENTTIGTTIYEKIRGYLSVYLDSNHFPKVQEFHFHIDVSKFMPHQRKFFKRKNSLSRGYAVEDNEELGNMDADDEREDENESLTGWQKTKYPDFSTLYSGSWSAVIYGIENKQFIDKLHAVISAKVVIDLLNTDTMRATSPLRDTDAITATVAVSSSSPDRSRQRNISVYLHGVEILLASNAHETNLSELSFSRTGSYWVISCKGGLIVRKSGDIVANAVLYEPSCCWRVSEGGFERHS